MAISHKDHEHPNTPAARAACRKRLGGGQSPLNVSAERALAEAAGIITKSTPVTVVPRKRGDGGVVKGLKATAPKVSEKPFKKKNSAIKTEGDLADVPRMLAYGVRMAWEADLDVFVGDRFNAEEARIVIQHEVAEIALVWKDSNPEGLHGVFVRNWDSSKTFRVPSVQRAFEVAASWEHWDENRNLYS